MLKKSITCLALGVAVIGQSTVTARPQEPYSADAAVSYARSWALKRNASYPAYESDCTNFVSQSLRAGGWRNTAIGSKTSDQFWYFVTASNMSQTWSVANSLHRHLKNGYETWYGWDGVSSLNYGDVVFADFQADGVIDHAMIVTGFKKNTSGFIEARVSYHSTDMKDFPISEFVTRVQNAGYKKAKYYRFGALNFCAVPAVKTIF